MGRFGDARYHGAHAVAGVEEQDHVERLFVVSEVADGLIEPVVDDSKAVAFQIAHRAAGGANFGIDTHERDVASNDELILKQQRQ
jgi:hypothetical protein